MQHLPESIQISKVQIKTYFPYCVCGMSPPFKNVDSFKIHAQLTYCLTGCLYAPGLDMNKGEESAWVMQINYLLICF
jgi:hypothetical protein